MKILKRLTLQDLKMHKKRTIVTVVGIILSTSLITGVAAIASSFRATYIDYQIAQTGDYHYWFSNVPASDLTYFENNRNIAKISLIKDAGYSTLPRGTTEIKKYFQFISGRPSDFSSLAFTLTEGRFPEKDHEICISQNYKEDGKMISQVGDVITLSVGQLIDDGKTVDPTTSSVQEIVIPEFTKQYTVTGIIGHSIHEQEGMPGYDCLIYDDQRDEGTYSVYARYTPQALKKDYQVTAVILGISADALRDYYKNGVSGDITSSGYQKIESGKYQLSGANLDLISMEELRFGTNIAMVLYEISAVVITVIVITSIYCIKNSFNISITERIRQFGILRSVGATRKQIRSSVLFEALFLSCAGIPLGILLGLFFNLILVHYSGVYLSGVTELTMKYYISPTALMISAAVGLITVFLSALKSADRANRIEPLTAIRGNEDIKNSIKSITVPKYIQKLFGVSGAVAYKNAKRDRKKYRTTVVSIVLCTVTYILMSYIMNSAYKAASLQYSNQNYNIYASISGSASEKENRNHEKKVRDIIGNDPYCVTYRDVIQGQDLRLTKDYQKIVNERNKMFPDYMQNMMSLVVVDDQSLQRYLKKLDLNASDIDEKAILVNTAYITSTGKKEVVVRSNYKAGDVIQAKVSASPEDVYKADNERLTGSTEIQLAAVTDAVPSSYVEDPNGINLIVSQKYADKIYGHRNVIYHINSASSEETVKALKNINIRHLQITSFVEVQRNSYNMFTMLSVFLYGFIGVIASIGITSIINTITSNMQQRQKEFASLQSIGMTRKEFYQMISLESLLYGTKSLLIGIPVGIVLSLIVYLILWQSISIGYLFPWKGVLISIAAVSILLIAVMRLSIAKISRQNIIETIRNENI